MQSSTSSNELIYGGASSAYGSEEASHVMSDKVQAIASAVYKEFESMIQKFGQESVKDLMPLVVNVLENLDSAFLEKDELAVDNEMLKEENEQLLNQYERERQMRKSQDQKYLEVEESLLEQNRELENKVGSMASIVRMLELKTKNACDHASRLEEREADQKMEYDKLHERYNELLRTHIDHVERTKFLMGTEMFDMANSLPVASKNNKNSMAMSAIDSNVRGISDIISAVHMSQSTHADLNLASHINSNERDWHEEFGGLQTAAEILATPREEKPANSPLPSVVESPKEVVTSEDVDEEEEDDEQKVPEREMNDDGDGISLGADLTGNLVDPAEFASAVNDTFIGMGREVENLIRENTELLETKNALNIVKNDLIARLDQLSSEHAVYREEARSLELVKIKLIERIRGLEDELKELKEAKNQTETPEEDKAQGRRFTRLEMARVLMERNQYKENFFELQEAVKFTELQRARRTTSSNNQNKSIIWSFFSNLLGDSTSTSHIGQNVKKSQTKKNIPSSPLTQRKARSGGDKEDKTNQDRFNAERRQHYHEVSQHMKQEDFPTAYGWSIPSTKAAAQNLSIPVPVNCRPLIENASPSLKICCAASCSLHGGLSNGEYIIGEIKKLNGSEFSLLESSSLVWICSSSEIQKPFVTILDVNCPNSILEGFEINEIGARIFCIASVSGIHYSDIRITEEGLNSDSELCTRGGYFEKSKTLIESIMDFELFGSVEFIKLQLSTKKGEGEATQTLIWEGQQKMTSPSKRRRDSSINESLQLNDTSVVNVEGYPSPSPLDKLSLHIRNTLKRYEALPDEDILTLPLMWIGTESEYIYIYSSVKDWRKCLRCIKMPDAVLSILHSNGRVFVALANGCIAVFHRDMKGRWSDIGFHLMQIGPSDASVCYLHQVYGKIWAACKNCIVVFDPVTLRVDNIFPAHPRKDSKIRQFAHYGSGVWISIRLDSTIRLFHAETYQHLQDLDVESFIIKMLDLVLLRITSLSILDKRIWIGIGSGIIVSIPFGCEDNSSNNKSTSEKAKGPGQVIRVMNTTENMEGIKLQ
uniref:Uncharacterized protein n=1 Tax=Meloidogyne enterolobii TaxID=390850 RepID=A0A6V7WG68_MELEN|nr:unnamed protein product [Meloidogyne enterolobii]